MGISFQEHINHLLWNALEEYKNSYHITCEEHQIANQFLDFISRYEQCFERSHAGHVTGSAWIVNHEQTHALLTHHKKYNSWFQLGGHADGDRNAQGVALKEAYEESGICNLQLITPVIFDLSIHPIPNQCEYHYDVRYLLQAPPDAVCVLSEESIDLAWISFDDLTNYTTEREVLRMNQKFLQFFKK
ncbi:NUDIX hydrolase [Candidatus Dependentiae bacterium Noda2021]|nr:NUDIX hydrolase [Candidatus Dependentiae bacterium Noda2021]